MSKVTHTRSRQVKLKAGVKTTTKRYRVCLHCGAPWSTIEVDEDDLEIEISDRGLPPAEDYTLRRPRD